MHFFGHFLTTQLTRLPVCLPTFLSVLLTESEFRFARWKKAVQRAMNWETIEPCCSSNGTRLSHEGNV